VGTTVTSTSGWIKLTWASLDECAERAAGLQIIIHQAVDEYRGRNDGFVVAVGGTAIVVASLTIFLAR
jgi:hypothetical protein